MRREIDADQRALLVESLKSSPFFCLWHCRFVEFDGIHAKERELRFHLRLLELLSVANKQVEEDVALLVLGNELFAADVARNGIEGTAQGKAFHSIALDG